MALIEVNWNPGRRELKQFALLWVGFFGLLGAYCLWVKGAPHAATVFWVVAAAGLAGYFLPGLMRPVYILWMALAADRLGHLAPVAARRFSISWLLRLDC